MINELRYRDALLFWTGALFAVALLVVTLLSISDTRLILGINPWIKPMKFLVSTIIFVWTVAWFMPEARPDGRARNIVRWTVAITMLLEMTSIILQSARGTASHFNIESAFNIAVFAVMGVAIGFNTLAMILFLAIVRRDTPSSRAGYIWGIRLGVAIFLLASFEGVLIILNGSHAVPGPDGGPGLPFVNWNTRGGDLRVAHFVGMHAMQAIPLIGFISNSRNLAIATSIIWVAVMSGLLAMALQGRPLFAL